MSGGSYNYFYSEVESIAGRIGGTPQRDAFSAHLRKVAQALHDIEWVDSCDYMKGDENKAIMEVVTPQSIIEAAVERAEKARAELDAAISTARASC